MPSVNIRWRAPEFEYRAKGASWYWISIIAAVLILAVAVWQRNFLFGLFVVMAEILLLVWGSREPETMEFALTEKGISVGAVFHDFREIEHWSAEERDEWPAVVLRFRRRIRPALAIRVPKEQWAEVKNHLRLAIPEVEHEESLVDTLGKFFGF